MKEIIIGTYECGDCDSRFEITGSAITSAYDGWLPVCPVCGTENDIQQTDAPEHTA